MENSDSAYDAMSSHLITSTHWGKLGIRNMEQAKEPNTHVAAVQIKVASSMRDE
jgi:hypothetical protein